MEGKTMVLSVVIVTLFMAQILVEAQEPKVCCPRENARWFYDTCRESTSWVTCLPMSGCIAVATGDICPPNYPYDMLKKPGQGDAVNEYCKLGCGFSACGALITLQNSDANEIVNGAVEQCTKACATICNKGSLAAVQNA
uniref:Putative thionin-2.4 n=1 Tax=Noccaea caerulescens TaxID=107243 RepID=A0A1J3DJ99_NOCCA